MSDTSSQGQIKGTILHKAVLTAANLLELLTELMKALCVQLKFYYNKGYKSEPAKIRDRWSEIWKGSKHEEFSLFLQGGFTSFRLQHMTTFKSQKGILSWAFDVRSFYWGSITYCPHHWPMVSGSTGGQNWSGTFPTISQTVQLCGGQTPPGKPGHSRQVGCFGGTDITFQ